MAKVFWMGLGVLVVVALGFAMFGITEPDEDAVRAGITGNVIAGEREASGVISDTMPVNNAASTFEFEGFGPGKSHDGTFDKWDADFLVEGEDILGFRGVIDATSVNTGIGGLDKHLKNEDFFDIDVYPTIEFSSMKIDKGMMYGDLTFLGITKEISFPVEEIEDGLAADFVLDTTPFGMQHIGTNKEVRIAFDLVK